MLLIKHLFILLIVTIVSSAAGTPSEWISEDNDYKDFIQTLRSLEGTNYLFNCKILIEKLTYPKKNVYWVSIWDQVRNNQVALSFDEAINEEDSSEKNRHEFFLQKNTDNDGKNLNEFFQLQFDFNGNLANIVYKYFYTFPYKTLNIIKCSSEL